MNLLYVNKADDPSGHTMTMFHSHDHYEIYVLTRGERSLFLNNSLYHVVAPCIVTIPPQNLHRTEGGAYERYNVLVLPQYLGEYEKSVLEKHALTIYSPSKEQFDVIVHLVQAMQRLDGKKDETSEHIVRSLFTSFVHVYSELSESGKTPIMKSADGLSYLSLKLVDYMNTHYGENISLSLLSEKFFVSKSSLLYIFKRDLKCTPMNFLLNLRIMNAKKLLTTSDKSVAEISRICGFSSPNYFGDIFKLKEQLTPMQYRKIRRIIF